MASRGVVDRAVELVSLCRAPRGHPAYGRRGRDHLSLRHGSLGARRSSTSSHRRSSAARSRRRSPRTDPSRIASSTPLHGHKRLYFDGPDGMPIDVFMGRMDMCHDLDLRDRLELSQPDRSGRGSGPEQAPDRRVHGEGPAGHADPARAPRDRRATRCDRPASHPGGDLFRLGLASDRFREPRDASAGPTTWSASGRAGCSS